MTLTTERLVLRPLHPDDAALHRRLWSERDPRVPAHPQIDSHGHPTVTEIAASIRDRRDSPTPGLLTVVVRGTGEAIGYCGLVHEGDTGAPEIAFELLQRTQGQGYATEAGSAVVTWATDLGHPRLHATVWAWNLPSRRMLAKLGFVEVGVHATDPVRGDSLLTVREPPRARTTVQ